MKHAPLKLSIPRCQLLGLPGCGYSEQRVIFLNGFCYPTMVEFLNANYSNITIMKMGRNADFTQTVRKFGQFNVICEESRYQLENNMFAQARKLTKNGVNVLVFGHVWQNYHTALLGPTMRAHFINTDSEATEFAKNCFGLAGAIVFVSWFYAVGLDLRMQREAQVYAIYDGCPDAEELMQTLGRGARDMSSNLGTAFIVRPANEARSIKDGILASPGHDW